MNRLHGLWQQQSNLFSHHYICGHCGSDIISNLGYLLRQGNEDTGYIYICHYCNSPTLIYRDLQVPAPKLGQSVDHLPKDIDDLYSDIRNASAAGSYTSAVLSARKLLMHVAVESGADKGKTFLEYVDYLVDNHYTPPNSKTWVDKIRKLGNDANHEIVMMGQTEAKDIVKFIESLLRFKYEFPAVAEDDSEDAA